MCLNQMKTTKIFKNISKIFAQERYPKKSNNNKKKKAIQKPNYKNTQKSKKIKKTTQVFMIQT